MAVLNGSQSCKDVTPKPRVKRSVTLGMHRPEEKPCQGETPPHPRITLCRVIYVTHWTHVPLFRPYRAFACGWLEPKAALCLPWALMFRPYRT
jgi:hypothetical protein